MSYCTEHKMLKNMVMVVMFQIGFVLLGIGYNIFFQSAAIQASVASLSTCVKGLQYDSIKNREKIETLDQRVQHLEDKVNISTP